MSLMKRATAKVKAAGIDIEIQKGLWGFYPYDRKLGRQTAHAHRTVGECVEAVLGGERPKAAEEEASE